MNSDNQTVEQVDAGIQEKLHSDSGVAKLLVLQEALTERVNKLEDLVGQLDELILKNPGYTSFVTAEIDAEFLDAEKESE